MWFSEYSIHTSTTLTTSTSRFKPFDPFRSSARQADPSCLTSGVQRILFLWARSPLNVSECVQAPFFKCAEFHYAYCSEFYYFNLSLFLITVFINITIKCPSVSQSASPWFSGTTNRIKYDKNKTCSSREVTPQKLLIVLLFEAVQMLSLFFPR
jgi:hypothetical protein